MGKEHQSDVPVIRHGRCQRKECGLIWSGAHPSRLLQKIHQHPIMTRQAEFTAEQSGCVPTTPAALANLSHSVCFWGHLASMGAFSLLPWMRPPSKMCLDLWPSICWLFLLQGILSPPTSPDPRLMPNFSLQGPHEHDTILHFWNIFSLISHSGPPVPRPG